MVQDLSAPRVHRRLTKESRTPAAKTGTEVFGWALALVVALLIMWRLVATSRSALLFTDGDSVLPVMIRNSLDAGQAQHWRLSPILPGIETVLYLGVTAVGVAKQVGLVLCGILSLLGVYGAVRFVSGQAFRGSDRFVRVASTVAAFVFYGVLCLSETSDHRSTIQLASLQATMTYFAATVIGCLLGVGLLIGWLRRAAAHQRSAYALLAWLVLDLTVIGVFNPVILPWLAGPLLFVGAVLLVSDHTRVPDAAALAGAAIIGGVLAHLLRLPLGDLIAHKSWMALSFGGVPDQFHMLFTLTMRRAGTNLGMPEVGLAFVVTIASVFLSIAYVRRGDLKRAGLYGSAWSMTLSTILFFVVAGGQDVRFLEPLYYAAVLGALGISQYLVSNCRVDQSRYSRRALAVLGGLAVVLGVVAIVPVASASVTTDPDVQCVASWADAHSDQLGAGRYWSVRAIKGVLAAPSQVQQIDATRRQLVSDSNKVDLKHKRVTFLVEEKGIKLAAPALQQPRGETQCGRFTILQYAEPLRLAAP